jgi:hypothetical protein
MVHGSNWIFRDLLLHSQGTRFNQKHVSQAAVNAQPGCMRVSNREGNYEAHPIINLYVPKLHNIGPQQKLLQNERKTCTTWGPSTNCVLRCPRRAEWNLTFSKCRLAREDQVSLSAAGV